MKKNIIKIAVVAVIIIIIIIGKNAIDKKTYDYTQTVNNSITEYFIKGDTSSLDETITLLEKYKNDTDYRNNIQKYSYEIVSSWFTYLDEKYLCDKSNLNSCKLQLNEFNNLSEKLTELYNYKTNDNFTIILPSAYTSLTNEVNKKIEGLNKIIKSPSATNPQTSEEIHILKCAAAVDCTDCKNGVCTCTYLNSDNKKETVSCQKDIEE